MHTVDLFRITVHEILHIITNAARTTEDWEEAWRNLGLRKPILELQMETENSFRFINDTQFENPMNFRRKFQAQKNQNQSGRKFKLRKCQNKSYFEQIEGIDKVELH